MSVISLILSMEMTINTIDELNAVAKKLLDFADGKRKMVFYGEIGAGKTTLIQAICALFKVQEQVTSPTFSLINEYSYPDPESGRESYLYHLDLYRLKQIQEALDIGIEDYLYDDHYCFIEWPEIIEPLLSDEVVRIKIELADNSRRKILFL